MREREEGEGGREREGGGKEGDRTKGYRERKRKR